MVFASIGVLFCAAVVYVESSDKLNDENFSSSRYSKFSIISSGGLVIFKSVVNLCADDFIFTDSSAVVGVCVCSVVDPVSALNCLIVTAFVDLTKNPLGTETLDFIFFFQNNESTSSWA